MPIKDPEKRAAYHKEYMRKRYQEDKEYRKIHIARQAIVKEQKREWFRELKSTYVCSKCGENNPACIDFHHPDKKQFSIFDGVHRNLSKDKILEEINNCVPLCANCHRKEHSKVR